MFDAERTQFLLLRKMIILCLFNYTEVIHQVQQKWT